MSEHEDWFDLPLNPETRRFIDATRQAHLDERAMILRFAPVLCRCTRWYDHQNPRAPQEECMVHTTIMFGMKGDWL